MLLAGTNARPSRSALHGVIAAPVITAAALDTGQAVEDGAGECLADDPFLGLKRRDHVHPDPRRRGLALAQLDDDALAGRHAESAVGHHGPAGVSRRPVPAEGREYGGHAAPSPAPSVRQRTWTSTRLR